MNKNKLALIAKSSIKRFIAWIIALLEENPTTFPLFLTAFVSIIILRIFVDFWLSGFAHHSTSFLFYEFTHVFSFYIITFFLFLLPVKYFAKLTVQTASTVIIRGFLLILIPPFLDYWISGGKGFFGFYKFDGLIGLGWRFLTFFGDRPDIGITYGMRIQLATLIILFGVYVYIKTKRFIRALSGIISLYVLSFFLGTAPSWLSFIFLGFQKSILSINDIAIAQLFLSPPILFSKIISEPESALNIKMSLIYMPLAFILAMVYFWSYYPKKFNAFFQNIRIPQLIYHFGLFCIGLGLALILTDAYILISIFNVIAFVNLILAIGCAWIASVIYNDLSDQQIDIITNTHRPLQNKIFSIEEYRTIGITFFSASLLFSAMVSFQTTLFLLIYQILAWMYSSWPFRLKRLPIIATCVATLASLLILVASFSLIAPEGNISKLPTSILLFFAFVFVISLPLKDFKDIAGDLKDNVHTIPVIFGEQWGKIIIGSGIFLSYIMSVSIFHEPKLFPWALLGGSVSFWILITSQPNEKKRLPYRYLPGWMLGPIILYGLIAVGILL